MESNLAAASCLSKLVLVPNFNAKETEIGLVRILLSQWSSADYSAAVHEPEGWPVACCGAL